MELDEAPGRLRSKASWLLSKAAMRAHRRIAEEMTAIDGRAHHFSILAALDEFGPDSQVRVGLRCGIDQSDMNALLGELTAQGHVVRTSDPDDRRRNVITLTPAGERRLAELDDILSAAQAEILHALAPGERRQLMALLARVVAQ
jgi:DNA-binding MarR family transcriptional regulator